MTPQRTQLLAVLISIPFLLASKCIEYDSSFGTQTTSSSQNDTSQTANSDSGAAGDTTFIPAEPCLNEGEAIIDVGDYYFAIVCGCLEDPWTDMVFGGSKECTVPAGTVIQWHFVGSEEHNVISAGVERFGNSNDRMAGQFEYHFIEAGQYSYSCTIHSEMTGYTIHVL